jgi:hypothetical protein
MMKRTLAAFVTAAFLAGAPALAKDASSGIGDAYSDSAKAMTDSMMKMMGAMFKMYNGMTRPLWSSTSQIFGEYGDWCATCHAQLSSIYDQMGSSFDPDVHKKLSDEELKKAMEAYKKSQAEKKQAK